MIYDDPTISYAFGEQDDEAEEDASVDIADIDLEALAAEVVKLLKRELRLESERQGWHRVW